MMTSTTLWAQATARAKHDHLRPITCQRLDTGETIWLVQSRSNPSRYYLLTMSGDNVHCACPQAGHHGICAHAAAVRLAIKAEPQRASAASPQPSQSTSAQAPHHSYRSESQREQERRQRAEAERRERALLWTDDRPFSIWKD